MEDEAIIKLFWERNEMAISETDKKYGHYCYKIAHNILQNAEDSEECVSDTYVRTWNSIPEDWPKNFSAYLGKITRNLSINRYRQRSAKKRGSGKLEEIFHELEGCLPDRKTMERELESKEMAALLNRFLNSLNDEHRIIFVRRYWYADSIPTIAGRFGLGENNVKTILYRCRNKLKQMLEKEGIGL